MPIGLYVHIPFCIKKCNYCDFVSFPYDADLAASYVYALQREMALYAAKYPDPLPVGSIYLGGGTPTLLNGEQVRGLLAAARQHFLVAEDAEITMEGNPGTVDLPGLQQYRLAGVNRLSLGVQACQAGLLNRLGRIHGWAEVRDTVRWSRMAGFDNLSVDLIFGIPGQSMQDWRESLERVPDLGPRHVSAYNLKIEPGTPFARELAEGRLEPCDEDLELEMYLYTIEALTGQGFRHYEISNFSEPGFASRHNLVYWRNEDYLGLGTGAHSKLDGSRFNNVESVASYLNKTGQGALPVEAAQLLTRQDEISETVFLSLRLMQGLNLQVFEDRFGQSLTDLFEEQIKKMLTLGLVEMADNSLRLTKKGIPLANEVFAEFV